MSLVPGALATAAAATVLSVSAPAPVTALAADGNRVAYAVGRSPSDCDRVFVWERAARRTVKLGRATSCERTSTGTGIGGLALAGNRVLWLHYTGGNIREWSLWTATTTRPKPRRLRFASRDVDLPSPFVLGNGDSGRLGNALPYASGATVIVLRADGSRRYSWEAPGRVSALSALGDEVAVASAGGLVTVLDLEGHVRRTVTYDGEISAVEVTGTTILAQTGRTLRLGPPGGRTWQLTPGARLVDATADSAVYVVTGRIHLLSLAGSRDAVVASGSYAQAEGLWLAVASGRQVVQREPVS